MTNIIESSTLHSALDIYAEQIGRQAGFLTAATIAGRRTVVRLLKQFHDNIPLAQIDLAACVDMIDLWKSRPVNQKTGQRYAASTAAKVLSELIRFFYWLDMSDQFQWTAPTHFGQVSRRVCRLPSDRRPVHREKFTDEHFAILYRHAARMQRLMLCLAMNCGLRAVEMGQLNRSNIIMDGDNDLMIDLQPGEGILRFVRPRTGACCEWLLWPETVEAAKLAIARADELGRDLLFVSDKGTPMGIGASRNPVSGFARHWDRLLKTVENQGVPKLPLGTLRTQMAERIRREYGDEVARQFLGHSRTTDTLTDYALRPAREALRELRTSLASVFEPHST
ncbi:hypothetical protein [Bremerella sp. P1]|uniref:hypothetical protein n=1 Tax=Bremerella sp. P1 TaxID=3026424 RepID=UPI00236889F1|nr:hypothetical protein [Bremerella sp. P1]WDI39852.1 hypothetical protein PSR63_15305 [Bremerella sp. P1]